MGVRYTIYRYCIREKARAAIDNETTTLTYTRQRAAGALIMMLGITGALHHQADVFWAPDDRHELNSISRTAGSRVCSI